MSADASAARTLHEEPPAAPAATPGPLTGDPGALGLPCFIAGSVSLGLALVGVVPAVRQIEGAAGWAESQPSASQRATA